MSAAELLDAPKKDLAKQQPINWELLREQALSTFDIQSEAIAKEVAADTQLIVTDDNTRKAAKERHWVWVKRRTSLDKTRKAASEDAKKIVELVKEVASSFQSEFDKAEQHLAAQIAAYDEALEREKQAKLDAIFNAKNSRLLAAGLILPRILVDSMSDIEIDDKISEAEELARFRKEQAEREAKAKAEADRLAAEEKERNRIEAEKLAKERAEFEKLKAKQEAEAKKIRELQEEAQRKIEEEAARLEKLNRERIEAALAEQRAAEKAELDRKEADERLRREAEETRIKAEKAEAARRYAEAIRPDIEKLRGVASAVRSIAVPYFAGSLKETSQRISAILADAANKIEEALS